MCVQIDIYVKKGFTIDEATRALTLMTKNSSTTDIFVDHMMIQELGAIVPGDDENPIRNGVVTFFSFIIFGSVPLWAYVIFYGTKYDNQDVQFGVAIGLTLFMLFNLGALQAVIVKQSLIKQGFFMMINGALAAGAAYLVGWGLQKAVGETGC